ncbi:MAG: hypothetical protein QXP81_11220 [Nitrososphaerota archaeon]
MWPEELEKRLKGRWNYLEVEVSHDGSRKIRIVSNLERRIETFEVDKKGKIVKHREEKF